MYSGTGQATRLSAEAKGELGMTNASKTWTIRFMPHGGYTIFDEKGHVVQ